MEELAAGIAKADRGEITLKDVLDFGFLAGMDLAIKRILYHLLAGSTLEEADGQTRSYCQGLIHEMQAVDADRETWQAITAGQAKA